MYTTNQRISYISEYLKGTSASYHFEEIIAHLCTPLKDTKGIRDLLNEKERLARLVDNQTIAYEADIKRVRGTKDKVIKKLKGNLKKKDKTIREQKNHTFVSRGMFGMLMNDIKGYRNTIRELENNLIDKTLPKYEDTVSSNNDYLKYLEELPSSFPDPITLMSTNQDTIKRAPEKLLSSTSIWILPDYSPRNTAFAKVILPDGRKAWEAKVIHVGDFETTTGYYYLTPKGLGIKTYMYAIDCLGKVKDTEEI